MVLIQKLKELPQNVFVIAIPEEKDIGYGDIKKYVKVDGKQLRFGNVEKEFVVVLFTNPIYEDESGELIDVHLKYKSNRFDTTKSPTTMFKGVLKNDLSVVLKQVKEFYARSSSSSTAKDT